LFIIGRGDFNQFFTGEKFESTLRYVAETIPFAGGDLVIRASYFPCVDYMRSHYKKEGNIMADHQNIDTYVTRKDDHLSD